MRCAARFSQPLSVLVASAILAVACARPADQETGASPDRGQHAKPPGDTLRPPPDHAGVDTTDTIPRWNSTPGDSTGAAGGAPSWDDSTWTSAKPPINVGDSAASVGGGPDTVTRAPPPPHAGRPSTGTDVPPAGGPVGGGGGGAGAPALPPVDSVIAGQMETLRPGAFRLRAPKTMVQGTPEVVRLRIAKDTVLPTEPADTTEVVHEKATRVGDSAEACLEGGDDFEIRHAPGGKACYTQLVTRGADNVWEWRVTPKNFGERLILVATVRALLAKLPGKTVYTESIAVAVAVKPCPLYRATCLNEWLTTWKGILTSAGGIVTLVLGWLGLKRRRGASPHPGGA